MLLHRLSSELRLRSVPGRAGRATARAGAREASVWTINSWERRVERRFPCLRHPTLAIRRQGST